MDNDKNPEIQKALFNVPLDTLKPTETGGIYLEQYKIYLEYTDKVIDRRQNANAFFLSLNTGIFAMLGYLLSKDTSQELKVFCLLLPVAGIILSLFWHRIVSSYLQLSTGKFAVLHLIENYLPLAPLKAEWIAIGEGKNSKLYKPVTHLEIWLPRLFIIVYCILIICLLPWFRHLYLKN